MKKIPKIIINIHFVISSLIFLWLNWNIFLNLNKYERPIDISIISEVKEKRYIEYYSKVVLSKGEENKQKGFSFKNYEFFCHCKNNTNIRIYDKYKCLTSKECNPNFQVNKDNYELIKISNWNRKKINYYKQKYIFFQGIKSSTGECDNLLKYKKCGFLVDLNTNFCIKEKMKYALLMIKILIFLYQI